MVQCDRCRQRTAIYNSAFDTPYFADCIKTYTPAMLFGKNIVERLYHGPIRRPIPGNCNCHERHRGSASRQYQYLSADRTCPGVYPRCLRCYPRNNTGHREKQQHPCQHPAVPVAQSVFPDYIVCLEDGKKLKMLKRHLQTRYGMTPTQYREKWQLPMDYPMVAPEYAKMRAALARDAGLGRKILVPPTGPVGEATVVPSVDSATKEISVDTSEAVVPAKKTISKRSRSSATETGSSAASPRKTPGSKTSARPRAIRKTGTKAKGAKV